MLHTFTPLLVFVASYMTELLTVASFLPKSLPGVMLLNWLLLVFCCLCMLFLPELVERFVSNSQTPSIPTIAINPFEHMFTCGQLVCSPASEITWSSLCSGYRVNTVMKFVLVMTVLHPQVFSQSSGYFGAFSGCTIFIWNSQNTRRQLEDRNSGLSVLQVNILCIWYAYTRASFIQRIPIALIIPVIHQLASYIHKMISKPHQWGLFTAHNF